MLYSAVMEYPRIRYVEAIPFIQDNREVVLLRDGEGVMEAPLVVSKETIFLLSLMDGTRTLRDIQADYMRTTGELIYMEEIERIVSILDKNLILYNENYIRHLSQLKREYEAEKVRRPALAGKSYPASKIELLEFLDKALRQGHSSNLNQYLQDGLIPPNSITGVIAPHIDYERGMDVYRDTYRHLYNTDKRVFIIIGTSHRPTEKIWSISIKDFATPLDIIPISKEISQKIRENKVLKGYIDEWPHRIEHSIELQLPLLQFMVQDDFEIIPILTGSMHEFITGERQISEDQEIEEIIENFTEILNGIGRPYLIIAAADMAHIGAQFGDTYRLDRFVLEDSRTKDEAILEPISLTDAEGFFNRVKAERDTRRICGLAPIYFILRLLKGARCMITGYRQWTDGHSSVSFAGALFSRDEG